MSTTVAPTAPVQTAVTSGRFGASAFLRIHAPTCAAVMAALALINIAEGGSVWIHWPLITWGAALALHAALVRDRSQSTRSPRYQILRIHEATFASTITMLLLVDLASGGGIWVYWPLAIWGTLLSIHEAAVRRYSSIVAS